MKFSSSVLAVAASRELYLSAPVMPEVAPVLPGVETYPMMYEAVAAPTMPVDFEGAYGATEYVVEESSTDLLVPALVVVALGLAGYSYGRASVQSEETPVEEYDPSALELAGPCPANVAMLGVQGAESRREFFAKAGAALASMAAVESASAKAGQFTKLSIFDIAGEPAISSPFQAGGPKGGQIGQLESATFGYQKSDGPLLATGYDKDITREKTAFEVSTKIIRAQQRNIDSKTWWLVRDNMRGQAYNMKANMLAINKVLDEPSKAKADKAYKEFWKEIDSLDLACKTKELALAQKEYTDVLEALTKYEATIASA
jgi:hypothetical protein